MAIPAGAGTAKVVEGESIQAAIDAASDGDVIFVGPGMYAENIVVNKSVAIKGAGQARTIVQSPDGNTVFTVVASNASITGLTIKDANNVWQSGILISGADNVSIAKNTIERNANGITIANSNGTSIVNNVVRYNDASEAGDWWLWPRVDNGNGIIVWDNGGGADLNTLIKSNDIYYNFKFGIFIGGATDMNADGTKINGNKLYRNGHFSIDANWLGMGFMNAMGTIFVSGNNVLPTASGLEYWVFNSPGLVLKGTPSYQGIPVPPAP
jgi:parallel beta-helix repeat protein